MSDANRAVLAQDASPQAPLSAQNLLRAGVPASEVSWFSSLKPKRQMKALQNWRGNLILERVRATAGGASMPLVATG